MTVTCHDSPSGLLDSAGQWLLQAEAENNLLVGICFRLDRFDGPEPQAPWLLTVEEDGSVNGAAIMIPPHNLIMSRLTPSGIGQLVDYLEGARCGLPGVVGPAPDVAHFAQGWTLQMGRRRWLHKDQRLYACEQVQPIQRAPGQMRHADAGDKEMLVKWACDFEASVGGRQDRSHAETNVDFMLASKSVMIWEHERPVSCAAFARETKNGVAVNFVYTPLAERGHGYASACVAALTERLLSSGKRFCCLYADLANPTSNKIYQKIGYRPVSDSQIWKFE